MSVRRPGTTTPGPFFPPSASLRAGRSRGPDWVCKQRPHGASSLKRWAFSQLLGEEQALYPPAPTECLCFFAGQEGILRCHPDLAGREQQRGTLTAESQREQSGAGLTSLGAEERQQLEKLNAQYRARFGFPFVLAARLSDRAAVPRELERRLHCQPAQELRTALGEVKKIGHLRLVDLLGADSSRL